MRNTIEEAIDGQLIINCFSKLTDPRKRGRCLHQLIDIIVITICGILCGAQHWKEIAEFGRQRIDWLKQFIELEHGIPSEQTFGRVFSLIPPEELLACFIEWSTAITALPPGTIIAIDGKTLRKSYHKRIEQKPLHLINAYVTGQRITIGAIKTPDKSNEIKGIPPLLKSLNIAGCVITIDAMGTQKGIANLIKMRGADYVLALKKNHKTLYRAVERLFNTASSLNYNAMLFKEDKTFDCEHSRIEHRFYRFLPIIYLPQFQKSWRGLQTIIEVRSFRDDNDGNQSAAVRYFISSISLNKFQLIHQAIREHWAVENSLHWKLDVAMNEDNCRVYNPQAAENFSTLRKLVLHCLENETKTNGGIAFKQWKAALSLDYLTKLINF
jgi:predicted transposase YbfD/YdcC